MLPESLQPLHDLAYNLWWCWDPEATALWASVDPHRWERNHHNPVALLADVEPTRFEALAADTAFVERVRAVHTRLQAHVGATTWFDQQDASSHRIAYFTMEIGLHESLPTYSGGLGVLAGDHLKSASDLGVPLVAVTLLYRNGYFRQIIDDGAQVAGYRTVDPARLPITRCLDDDGQPIVIEVPIADQAVLAHVYRATVGRCSAYFLDVDLPDNSDDMRALSGRLYGGDEVARVRQEVLLGIGGVRALRALGVPFDVVHLNEGHCALAPLELIQEHMDNEHEWDEAVARVRRQCCFTTHTPVAAGHDRFDFDTFQDALDSWRTDAGWRKGTLMDLGRVEPGEWEEKACMTVVALRTCATANGVSQKHGEVSRDMWQDLWPELPVEQVPIGHITNGVHPGTWTSAEAQTLFDAKLPGWRDQMWDEDFWTRGIDAISDREIWDTRNALRARLIESINARKGTKLDPHALTIGFARRFAGYKRGDLIFSDPDRLERLLAGNPGVQIVFSGKAHPRDEWGQSILANVVRWAESSRFRDRIVFLEDYDIAVGRELTSGVDLWLNNPRRPMEASGTSGQKVCLNFGLNFSVLDGWWLEGFAKDNGWAIGTKEALEKEDDPSHDAADADDLYRTLEEDILPMWNDRTDGVPAGWIHRVRRCVATCVPAFSSHRMVRDYVERIYAPAPAITS